MATISYKCDSCNRTIELVENPQGLTVVGKCVITSGCTGRLYTTGRNLTSVRESSPKHAEGVDNYIPRKSLFVYTQELPSDSWLVTHDMGTSPSITVYVEKLNGNLTLLGKREYSVTVLSNNIIYLEFKSRVKGVVQCVTKSTIPSISQSVPEEVKLVEASTNGIITFAVPKFITQLRGTVQIPPLLPFNVCEDGGVIHLEIEVTKPNEDSFICFEDIHNTVTDKSPWYDWREILVDGRRDYCIRTVSLNNLKVFEGAGRVSGKIPNGTRIRFLRIDYGTGRKKKYLRADY